MNDYYDTLMKIIEFMRRQDIIQMPQAFPVNHCDHTSRLVREIIGLELFTGEIKIKGNHYRHTCNYDRRFAHAGHYVDLTRQQFGLIYPEIVLEKKEDSIFIPSSDSVSIVRRTDDLIKPSIEKLVKEYRRLYS